LIKLNNDIVNTAKSFAAGLGLIGRKYDAEVKLLRKIRSNRNASPGALTKGAERKLRKLLTLELYECKVRIMLGHFHLAARRIRKGVEPDISGTVNHLNTILGEFRNYENTIPKIRLKTPHLRPPDLRFNSLRV
jgi:hypothetical protein